MRKFFLLLCLAPLVAMISSCSKDDSPREGYVPKCIDLSAWRQMNLKGQVKKLTHIEIIGDDPDITLRFIYEFNTMGRCTKITEAYFKGQSPASLWETAFEYDDQGRPIKITFHNDRVLSFIYGADNKYIPTLFLEEDPYRIFPLFIRGIESQTYYSSSGSCESIFKLNQSGTALEDELSYAYPKAISFAGDMPEFYWGGYYTYSRITGNLISESYSGGNRVYTYFNDRYNNLKQWPGFDPGDSPIYYKYNSSGDMISRSYDGMLQAPTYSYEYDSYGNWTKQTPSSSYENIYTRSIEYW